MYQDLSATQIERINQKLDPLLDAVTIAKVRPIIETCQFKNDANLPGALFHHLQQQEVKHAAGIC